SLLCAREEWSTQFCAQLHMPSTCYYSIIKPGNYVNVARLKPFDLAETPCRGTSTIMQPSIYSDATPFWISSMSGLTAKQPMRAIR
ncbi:hypothetical protein PENTCL1PPCAC_20702, partial [Pristionchus entomophagus]